MQQAVELAGPAAEPRTSGTLWPFLLCLAFFLAASEIFANLRSHTGFSQSLRLFLKQGGRAK